MWKAMQEFSPGVFVDSTEQGIELVTEGEYAFLLESRMLEYIIQRSCDLTQVGGLLDSKGYGIGTPRGTRGATSYICYLLPPTRRLCNARRLFLCLFVCLLATLRKNYRTDLHEHLTIDVSVHKY